MVNLKQERYWLNIKKNQCYVSTKFPETISQGPEVVYRSGTKKSMNILLVACHPFIQEPPSELVSWTERHPPPKNKSIHTEE